MNKLIIIFFAFVIYGCAMKKESTISHKKEPNIENPLKKTGEIVEKTFVRENGELGEYTELYFRASVQDYYIKFCESSVTKDELLPYIDKVISVEGYIVTGNLDNCPDSDSARNRNDYYLIINKLLL